MESDANFETDSKSDSESDSKTKEKKYKCSFPNCNAAFPRPFKLQHHLNLHCGKRPYKCSFADCDKSYTNPSHLKRHAQTHTKIGKSHVCEICSAHMSTLSNLKRHYKRAHDKGRELKCHECNKVFRKKSLYAEHMESHEKPVERKCEKCGKLFSSSYKLQRHQREHKSRNHKCPVEGCSEVFEKWALLVEHKNTKHETVYPCTKCKKEFLTRSYLRTHSKIHVKERPVLPCSYEGCNRLYYFKRNLKAHIRTKHIGNKFHCDICNIKVSTKQKIRQHIISQHLSEKKPFKRKAQVPRKDKGLAKRSVLSQLTGIKLSVSAEIQLMKREPIALLRDRAIEESLSEEDRASDVSAKGA